MSVQHDAPAQKFTLTRAGHPAELAYTRPDARTIDFVHTFVAEALRGQGLGEELARAGLAYARTEHLAVRTSCAFMAAYVQRHPEAVGQA